MKERITSEFDDREEEIAKSLQELGLSRKEARLVTFLSTVEKGESRREIEIKAGLRQPEVSVSLKSLQARGFVDRGSLKLVLNVETIANMLYETKLKAAKAALEKVNGPDQVRIKLRV